MCVSLWMCTEVQRHQHFQANFFLVKNNVYNETCKYIKYSCMDFHNINMNMESAPRLRNRTLPAPQNHPPWHFPETKPEVGGRGNWFNQPFVPSLSSWSECLTAELNMMWTDALSLQTGTRGRTWGLSLWKTLNLGPFWEQSADLGNVASC